jgi:very-short-patch-repair endonuclease
VPTRLEIPDALRLGPFTTARARELGVSPTVLQGSQWRHVFRDVWVHDSIEDDMFVRVAAARLVLGREGFLCGLTAAWVYGVEVQDGRGLLVWVGRPTGSWRRPRAGCLLREITVKAPDLDLINGTFITTPLRTAFDCARWLRLSEAVVVADAFAAAGLISRDDFAAYVRSHRALRGVRQADVVAKLIEPLSESPMESRLRVLLITSGFQSPVAQYVVTDRAGKFIGRADLAFPRQRLIVEYDGSLHWEQRRDDDRRRDAMRELGWTVLVASRADYYEHADEFIATVRRAMQSAAA